MITRYSVWFALVVISVVQSEVNITVGSVPQGFRAIQNMYRGNYQQIEQTKPLPLCFHNATDVTGRAVLVTFNHNIDGYPSLARLAALSERGAAAIIILPLNVGTDYDSFEMYSLTLDDLRWQYKVTAPVFEFVTTNAEQLEALLVQLRERIEPFQTEAPEEVMLTYRLSEMNQWSISANSHGFFAYQYINAILAILCIVVALWRLSGFWMLLGFQISIPQVCLVLELISLFLKLISLLFDPFYSRVLFPTALISSLSTVFLPFWLSAAVLIVFYWYVSRRTWKADNRYELISDAAINTAKFLSVYRYPAFVAIGVMFVMEFVSSLCRALWVTLIVPMAVSSIIYLIVMLTLCGCYWITGFRLSRRLKAMQSSTISHKVTFLIFYCGIGFIGCAAVAIAVLTPPFFESAAGLHYIGMSLYLISTIVSIGHCFAFEPPNQRLFATTHRANTTSLRNLGATYNPPSSSIL